MITTFSQLKVAVSDWLDRDDLGSELDTFVSLMETDLYRRLRIASMEAALDETIASGVIPVPSNYLEFKEVYLNTDPKVTMRVTSPYDIHTQYPSHTGRPRLIAREPASFIFGPTPDSDYNVRGTYYAKPEPLGVSNESNWFTANASDALLFGTLVAATPYIGDDERAVVWKTQYEAALESLREQDVNERWNSRGPLVAVAR